MAMYHIIYTTVDGKGTAFYMFEETKSDLELLEFCKNDGHDAVSIVATLEKTEDTTQEQVKQFYAENY